VQPRGGKCGDNASRRLQHVRGGTPAFMREAHRTRSRVISTHTSALRKRRTRTSSAPSIGATHAPIDRARVRITPVARTGFVNTRTSLVEAATNRVNTRAGRRDLHPSSLHAPPKTNDARTHRVDTRVGLLNGGLSRPDSCPTVADARFPLADWCVRWLHARAYAADSCPQWLDAGTSQADSRLCLLDTCTSQGDSPPSPLDTHVRQ
jgi:hypothetical protein